MRTFSIIAALFMCLTTLCVGSTTNRTSLPDPQAISEVVTLAEVIGVETVTDSAETAPPATEMLIADMYVKRPAFTSAEQAMAFFRGNVGYTWEESNDIGLTNGMGVQDKMGRLTSPLNFLKHLSGKVPVQSMEDKLVLMTYLKDENLNLRFIAAFALEEALSAERAGVGSVTEVYEIGSKEHQEMVARFSNALLEKTEAHDVP